MNPISADPNISPLALGVAALVVVPLGIVLLVYLIVPAFKGVGWLIMHVGRFVGAEISDLLRMLGTIIVALVLVPLTLANVIIARWSAAAHYGRAIESEGKALLGALYRVLIGNPAKLLMLTPLTEGLERRVPHAVLNAPAGDAPPKRAGQFEGYAIIGSLPGGGSGSKLYVAHPTAQKLAAFARAGLGDIDRVVIKSFSLLDGSSLPQIVRENRALPAAKRLGLILEHQLSDDKFFYVTRFVPGDPLSTVATRLYALSGADGLSDLSLRVALGYAADLLRTLDRYHAAGLWHKDVKPDNIIVSEDRAHLVDFGLVTPLRSSITLTTHGTEYFRDPEMVRMALRGVKVHEVDGVKFDLYAAGAVLFSLVENSFPAHGGLSRIAKRCPESLRWIVRRAMADYDKRYESAETMLRDVETVLAAPNPFSVRPADLPSFSSSPQRFSPIAPPDLEEVGAPSVAARSPVPNEHAYRQQPFQPRQFAGIQAAQTPHAPPVLRVTNWWSGSYAVDSAPAPASGHAEVPGRSAAVQLANARRRADAARARAQQRLSRNRAADPGSLNVGVIIAMITLLVAGGVFGFAYLTQSVTSRVLEDPALQNAVTIDLSDSGGPAPETGARVEATPVKLFRDASELLPIPAPPAPPAQPETHAQRPPAPAGAPLLVVRDQVTFETGFAPRVDAQIAALRMAGFDLWGNPSQLPPTDPLIASFHEDLLARFRVAVGLSGFRSSDALHASRAWLNENSGVGAIVWFGRSEDGSPHAWIVSPGGSEPDGAQSAALRLAVQVIEHAVPPTHPAPPAPASR